MNQKQRQRSSFTRQSIDQTTSTFQSTIASCLVSATTSGTHGRKFAKYAEYTCSTQVVHALQSQMSITPFSAHDTHSGAPPDCGLRRKSAQVLKKSIISCIKSRWQVERRYIIHSSSSIHCLLRKTLTACSIKAWWLYTVSYTLQNKDAQDIFGVLRVCFVQHPPWVRLPGFRIVS